MNDRMAGWGAHYAQQGCPKGYTWGFTLRLSNPSDITHRKSRVTLRRELPSRVTLLRFWEEKEALTQGFLPLRAQEVLTYPPPLHTRSVVRWPAVYEVQGIPRVVQGGIYQGGLPTYIPRVVYNQGVPYPPGHIPGCTIPTWAYTPGWTSHDRPGT